MNPASKTLANTLNISIEPSPEGAVFCLKGFVDENVRFDQLPVGSETHLIFDLGGVHLISSLGIRGWVSWMKARHEKSFVFRRCSKAIVDQINVLEGFLPPISVIESFLVPYHCDTCEYGEQILFRQGVEFEKGTADRKERISPPANVTCPKCHSPMEIDVIESKYFRFLKYRR